MKKYVKPSVEAIKLQAATSLAGSVITIISEDPATGPAQGKGGWFADEESSDE